MNAVNHAAAAAVSLACALAIAGLSRLSYDATTRTSPYLSQVFRSESSDGQSATQVVSPADAAVGAVIRLSWRTTSERVEECRRLSEEERAALPVHMRREEVCEGRMLPYHLRVTLDDRVVVDELVQPAGARGDRPLYVYRELAVPAGEQRLAVQWEREDGTREGRREGAQRERDEDNDRDERREGREPDRRPGAGEHGPPAGTRSGAGTSERAPASLSLRATLMLEPRDVALITYDPEVRSLVARGRGIVDVEPTVGTRALPESANGDDREPADRERDRDGARDERTSGETPGEGRNR